MTPASDHSTARNRTEQLARQFEGFTRPTANFIYCPNQFFEVCLPNCSRNVVRIVAYLLYSTLRWLDKDGNPIEQNVRVSYSDLIVYAGVSRGAIRPTIDAAIEAGYIVCTQQGIAKKRGQSGKAACYSLKWDDGAKYSTDVKCFHGFYAGEGHRTPIPNAFFDHVIPTERLAVIKVVGTVLRHTVGYQNQFGGRRATAPLSYSYIQRFANLNDRSSLASAIRAALEKAYIRRVTAGVMASDAAARRSAVYAVNWLADAEAEQVGSKSRPVTADQFKSPTRISSETKPANRFKNPTKRNTRDKDTYKQPLSAAAANEISTAIDLLTDTGFDRPTAFTLATGRHVLDIQKQIEWMKYRQPDTNPLGMLRMAIEHEWQEPPFATIQRKKGERAESERSSDEKIIRRDAEVTRRKREIRLQRLEILPRWQALPKDQRGRIESEILEGLHSDFDRRRFRENADHRLNLVLDTLSQTHSGR